MCPQLRVQGLCGKQLRLQPGCALLLAYSSCGCVLQLRLQGGRARLMERLEPRSEAPPGRASWPAMHECSACPAPLRHDTSATHLRLVQLSRGSSQPLRHVVVHLGADEDLACAAQSQLLAVEPAVRHCLGASASPKSCDRGKGAAACTWHLPRVTGVLAAYCRLREAACGVHRTAYLIASETTERASSG